MRGKRPRLSVANAFALAFLACGAVVIVAYGWFVARRETARLEANIVDDLVVMGRALEPAIAEVRDREGDARVRKRTLAVRFGETFARAEVVVSVLAAAAVPVALAALTHRWGALLATAACALLVPSLVRVARGAEGMALNRVLAATGKLLLVYGLAFAVGWAAWKGA